VYGVRFWRVLLSWVCELADGVVFFADTVAVPFEDNRKDIILGFRFTTPC